MDRPEVLGLRRQSRSLKTLAGFDGADEMRMPVVMNLTDRKLR